MRKKLQRLLRAAPLALLFAGVASAQTTGTIIGVVTDAQSGKPVVGALVTATSKGMQGPQTVETDKSGAFRLQSLPPGEFKLSAQADTYKVAERTDLTVRLDKTIRANLALVPESVQLEEQVVRTGMAPVVNVGSAETGTVVSKEFTSDIPGSRGFQNIAIVAPTAQFDALGVSFGGTTSNENIYLIDGLSVNNPMYGTLGSQILNNFVEEIDVKTGAFMPEYGFASGGIVSVATKSGSNEFHGSVFGTWTPGKLAASAKGVTRTGEAIELTKDNKNLGTYLADFGAEVGGPIIKDRIWFYAGIAPNLQREVSIRTITASNNVTGDAMGSSSESIKSDLTQVQYVGKLTFLANENNALTVTGIYAPTSGTVYLGSDVSAAAGTGDGSRSSLTRGRDRGFGDVVGRYTSKLLDKRLLIEAVAGYHSQHNQIKPVSVDGVDQKATSVTLWANPHPLSDFEALPSVCSQAGAVCNVSNYTTGGLGAYDKENSLTRSSGKLSAGYLFDFFGSHSAKLGAELQRTEAIHTKGYGGNAFFTEVNIAAGSTTTTLAPGVYLNQNRGYGFASANRQSYTDLGETSVKSVQTSKGYFLQDSYSPVDGLTLNAGLRWEQQSLSAPSVPDSPSFDIKNNYAPRFQAIYDWTKQGRSKVSVNWGRSFANIPLDMADRAFGLERGYQSYRGPVSSCVTLGNPAVVNGNGAGSPQGCAPIINAYKSTTRGLYTYGQTGGASEPVAPNLQGSYGDTFGAAVEYEVLTDLSVGIEYTGRRLGTIIEDQSTDDGNTYFIANPGTGKPFSDGAGGTIDPKFASVATDAVTGATYSVAFPKPVRDYDAVSLTVKKNYSKHWQALASYTYSSLRGNYPGFYSDTNGQNDPGISSMFDLVGLLTNMKGPLPGDSPHQFKLFGSYTFDLGSRLSATAGGSVRAQSGTPVNYLAAGPLNSGYGQSEAFVLQRGSGGRVPTQTQADLRGQIAYVMTPPYTVKFSVDLINVLNNQYATTVDQDWTYDSVPPIGSAKCSNHNAAEKSDKIGAALTDCPALNYLRTQDGLTPTINKNWGQAVSFAAPLQVRLGLQITF